MVLSLTADANDDNSYRTDGERAPKLVTMGYSGVRYGESEPDPVDPIDSAAENMVQDDPLEFDRPCSKPWTTRSSKGCLRMG